MSQAAKPPIPPQPGKPPQLSGPRYWVAFLGLFLLLVGIGVVCLTWPRGDLGLPELSGPGLDPEVRAAIESARQQVLANPRSGDAWGELGLVLYAHALYPDAVVCFTQAETLNRRDRRWPYFLGLILIDSEPERALVGLRRAAVLSPGDPVPQLRLAEGLLLRDQLDESDRAYQQTLALSPGNPTALLGLGRIAYQRGDLLESLRCFQQASNSPLSRRAAWAAMAEAYRRQGDEMAAASAERLALQLPADQLWPDQLAQEAHAKTVGPAHRSALAWQRWKSGDTTSSLALLAENIRRNPNDAASIALTGAILYEKRDLPAAEKSLREAVRMNPEDGQSHQLLGAILFDCQNYDDAIEAFERALPIQANSTEVVSRLAQCYALKGNRAKAIATLRTGVRYRPEVGVLHTELGCLLLLDGRPAEALPILESAARLVPGDTRTQELLEEARFLVLKTP